MGQAPVGAHQCEVITAGMVGGEEKEAGTGGLGWGEGMAMSYGL